MPTLRRCPRARRAVALAVLLAGGAGGLLHAARPVAVRAAGDDAGAVVVLAIDGVINPITARYVTREVAAARDAALVVLRLDTPGGLDGSMREVVRALLASPAPVAVYVAPPGARAASAGMFVTLAAHVAAMAPDTAIGAAHPVTLGGAADEVTRAKVTNDAAALARSLAASRGRDAAWAELAVRESLSLTAREAEARGVVDLVAADQRDLLRALQGRQVTTAAGARRLDVAGAEVVERRMSPSERLLDRMADPDIAFLLLSLGALGILAELLHPGALAPGVLGAIALVLGFVALGNLPVNGAGLLLLGLGLLMVIGEAFTPGIGVLAVGGGLSFLLGALLLYRPLGVPSPAWPDLRPSPWVVGVALGATLTFVLAVLRAAVEARRAPVATGPEALLGRRGVAATDLAPRGVVRVDQEPWNALVVGDAPVLAGEAVVVVGVEGVTVKVVRAVRSAELEGLKR